MFFAPTRQPVMHAPHSVQAVRSGPAPPKYGSGTVSPGTPARPVLAPKNTPTGVEVKVLAAPICSATVRITRSDSVTVGLVTTPSIRRACS
ncbi:Uncharacterised protein [Mycobacteroides abscessus subsp. abscessus]|nr:Uncharacterised protein [Mycobacteroides abscessus subsp. abscessus]